MNDWSARDLQRREMRLALGPAKGKDFADLHWSFGEMLAHASRGKVLRPGDVIGSGTCGTGLHPGTVRGP